MNNNDKLGTLIHGIASSQSLDSSGERVSIEGMDISSLTRDGILNTEHKSEQTSQYIGKIIEAKKIFKKEDCENKHHEYFWDKAGKIPYLYIKAVLFDKFGHTGALDAVAMFKFDKQLDKKNTATLCGFSVEGSRLGANEGSTVKKSIIRKVSFTSFNCNKTCIAEILEEDDDIEDKEKLILDAKKILAAFKKAEKMESDEKKLTKKEKSVNKGENGIPTYNKNLAFKLKPQKQRDYTKITQTTGENKPATPMTPKRTMDSKDVTPKTQVKVGDRISYNKPKAKTGASIYKDPSTWNKEEIDRGMTSGQIRNKGIALSEKKVLKKKILKKMANECFDSFSKKEELIKFIENKFPEMAKNEVLALAKTYATVQVKKKENKLSNLVKAKSDTGLAPREKMKVREARKPISNPAKELNPDQYEQAKRTARSKKLVNPKVRSQNLKDALHTNLQTKQRKQSTSDIGEKTKEYKLAASEKTNGNLNKGDVLNFKPKAGNKVYENIEQEKANPAIAEANRPSYKNQALNDLHIRMNTHENGNKFNKTMKQFNSKGHNEPYAMGDVHDVKHGTAKQSSPMWNEPLPIPVENVSDLQGHLGKEVRNGGPDPFMYMDMKYKVTHNLLDQHKDKPLKISTRSDLIAHDAYINKLNPKLHEINIHFPTTNNETAKHLEPGAPSVLRRLKAAKKLIDKGFKVNLVHDAIEGVTNNDKKHVDKNLINKVLGSKNGLSLVGSEKPYKILLNKTKPHADYNHEFTVKRDQPLNDAFKEIEPKIVENFKNKTSKPKK